MTTYSLIFNEDEETEERFIIVVQKGQKDLVVVEGLTVFIKGKDEKAIGEAANRAAHLCAPYEYWLAGENLPQDDKDFTETLSYLYNT